MSRWLVGSSSSSSSGSSANAAASAARFFSPPDMPPARRRPSGRNGRGTRRACASSGSRSSRGGGLLLHQRDRQAVAPAQLAVVQRRVAGDDREERGLAGAVAADEAEALAALQGERRAVEERQLAVREAAFIRVNNGMRERKRGQALFVCAM
jgi:hypothetical protein